ncbi:hypothetical protein BS47DRAFT_1399686 [Hydnum rufescens UP504]|uniref:Uncharacterized protein n=1 Tax=Hydnum rufescens UP504 TaxID=1448309 RepID=A0A9P6AHZ9_9AGAM|nr:hypothetical protein BS47DRAFT_1399686 [Hydnum rufescens UP504]
MLNTPVERISAVVIPVTTTVSPITLALVVPWVRAAPNACTCRVRKLALRRVLPAYDRALGNVNIMSVHYRADQYVLAFLATNDACLNPYDARFVVKIVQPKSVAPVHLRTTRIKSAISSCRRHANSPLDSIGVLISDPSQATTVSIAPAADSAAVHPGGSSPMFTIT